MDRLYVQRLALAKLNTMIRKLPVVFDVPALLGHEGAATAQYWPALAAMVQPDWALAGRTGFVRRRRPASDAFNVVLNYLAALLGRDLFALAQRHGLHPGFGALHSAADGEHALVYDLMEEFRAPLAEGLGRLPVQQPDPAPGHVRDASRRAPSGWAGRGTGR